MTDDMAKTADLASAFQGELQGLLAEMDTASDQTKAFARSLSTELSQALHSVSTGSRSFSDALKTLALDMADQSLKSATKPLTDMMGNLAGAMVQQVMPSASPRVTMNVQTPDVGGFGQSQAQIAARMQRMLTAGQRNI